MGEPSRVKSDDKSRNNIRTARVIQALGSTIGMSDFEVIRGLVRRCVRDTQEFV